MSCDVNVGRAIRVGNSLGLFRPLSRARRCTSHSSRSPRSPWYALIPDQRGESAPQNETTHAPLTCAPGHTHRRRPASSAPRHVEDVVRLPLSHRGWPCRSPCLVHAPQGSPSGVAPLLPGQASTRQASPASPILQYLTPLLTMPDRTVSNCAGRSLGVSRRAQASPTSSPLILVVVARLAGRALNVRTVGASHVDRLHLAGLRVGGQAELDGLALGERLRRATRARQLSRPSQGSLRGTSTALDISSFPVSPSLGER